MYVYDNILQIQIVSSKLKWEKKTQNIENIITTQKIEEIQGT